MKPSYQPDGSSACGKERAKRTCDCADPGCPVHLGTGCHAPATTRLYRIDQYDEDGEQFCAGCADDALASGVFADEPGDGYADANGEDGCS